MRLRWLLITVLVACAASPVAAQEPGGGPRPAPADTGAAAPDLRVRLGLRPLPLPFAIPLRSLADTSLWLRPRYTDWTAAWARRAREALRARRPRLGLTRPAPGPPAADTVAYLPPLPRPDTVAGDGEGLPGLAGEYADLGLAVNGRAEMGGAWARFRPCDPAVVVDCTPSLFPRLTPEVQFGVRVAGTIADRIHVDVDYDQTREFAAANNINVYYQGLEDEVIQRVEVGDVSITLPTSEYLTQGIPAGNFGFKTTGQLGPLDFQAVWAQQQGDVATREFRLGGGAGDGGLVQDMEVVLDDARYAAGQFFFLVHPDSLAGSPHLDVLELGPTDAPASLRPAGGTLQLYRSEPVSARDLLGSEAFLADAVSADGAQRFSGHFRRLNPGQDYEVHKSGLWIVLRTRLQPNEALAVAYVTEAGDTVGTLNADHLEAAESTPALRLLRDVATDHHPGQSTWAYEMHQVYRLDSSSGVDPSSVELEVSLGDPAAGVTYRAVDGEQVPFLRLFGLDEDRPVDRLDGAHIYQPGRGGLDGGVQGAGVSGTFVIFPTLRPFAEPPPVPSAGLTAGETRAVLGRDLNPAIYEEVDPAVRESSARFRLRFRYRVRMESGLVSSFNLGGLGVRQGSEKITVDGRVLERGTDYTIDYDLGQVTLTNPQELFATNPDAEIQATYEQKALFQVAPTSIFGLNARYGLGERGELNFVGLYQREKSLMARPHLGIEPGAIFLGGASGELRLGAGWLDRLLDRLPGLDAAGASGVDVAGELALSAPTPNTRGETYLDDFEATDQIPIPLTRELWRLGSRPQDPRGALDVLPPVLDAATAAPLVWQHSFPNPNGNPTGQLYPRQIDRQINVGGNPVPEPVLYVSFGGDGAAGDGRRWRSMTRVIAPNGRDLTRSEYLEFYAYVPEGSGTALVLDLGEVSEDAFFVDAEGRTRGTYPDGTPWGLGVLDEEARLAEREIWGPDKDSLGLWNQDCRAEPGGVYPLGDPRANCTVGNNLLDTEDLNGNGLLDNGGNDGAYFRYVVRLDEASPYLVRDRNGTGTRFRLFRIPLRTGAAVAVNGAHDGTWRHIKHLRVTVTGPPTAARDTSLILARMRILGSRWTKRDVHGILRGVTERTRGSGAQTARLRVGPVSRITDGAAYASPPGVRDQLQDPTRQLGAGGVEFNEKALRLAYEALEAGDRGEAYYRYLQEPRNLLRYRSLRLWAAPRRGRWGAVDGERLVVKLGTDAENFYLYQHPLGPAAGETVRPGDWRELVIDFDEWFELKARAEEALITGADTLRGPDGRLELWSADSTYAIVLEDRARAPNLAAVREIAFAVYNAGAGAATGEVWVNDMRLDGAVTDPGYAGRVDVDVRAGDFATARLSYGNRGAFFRQLNEDASYLSTGALTVNGTTRLGRLAPEAWGVEMPLSVSYTRTGEDPTFLERSDVPARRLEGVRETGQELTRVGLSLRKRTPSSDPLLGLLVDGASVRLGYNTARRSGLTLRSESRGVDGGVSYERAPAARTVDATPGFVDSLVRLLLPAALEESELARRITGARLRWTPEAVSLSTRFHAQENRSYHFERILATPADTAVRPIVSPRRGLESRARLALRPFESLSADVAVSSNRDLLPPARAAEDVRAREAVDAARATLAGLDVGWETNRSVDSQLSFRPRLFAWLEPGLTYSARFLMDRSPSYVEEVVQHGDTTGVLQGTFQGERRLTRSLLLDPAALVRSTAVGTGGARAEAPVAVRLLRAVGRAVEPLRIEWTTGVSSQFDRETARPGLGYQLGLGTTDAFRVIDGDTAADVLDRSRLRLESGLRLPWQLSLRASYVEGESDAVSLRGGRHRLRERSWPDLQLAWYSVPIPAVLRPVVSSASVSGGWRLSRRSSRLELGADRRERELSVPLQLSVGLANGMSLTYNGSFARGASSDPTGDAEQSATNHSVQLRGSFRAPAALRAELPHPVQAALAYSYRGRRQCRVRPGQAGAEACVPFVHSLNRTFDLTLDTMLAELNVGLQMSYTDRQSYIGSQRGSSNFELRLFGNFNFSAGTFPGGTP